MLLRRELELVGPSGRVQVPSVEVQEEEEQAEWPRLSVVEEFEVGERLASREKLHRRRPPQSCPSWPFQRRSPPLSSS